MAVMLIFQAINWFGPEPKTNSPALYITGLFAFAILTGLAHWVGASRWHRNQVGLGVALIRR